MNLLRVKNCVDQILIACLVLSMMGSLTRCEFIRMKKGEQTVTPPRKAVARVNDKYLYQDELVGIVDQNSTAEDSAARVTAISTAGYENSFLSVKP
jgi:hypothetical protein